LNGIKTCLLFLILINSGLQAQSQVDKVYAGINYGRFNLSGYTPRNYGGLNLDIQLESNLGFHYNISFARDYFHMPAVGALGFQLGAHIASSKKSTDTTNDKIGLGIFIAILGMLIPEGIYYNFQVNDWLSFAPYLNPLQMDFISNKSTEENRRSFGGALGIRTHLYFSDKKFRISPYAEYKIHYDEKLGKGPAFGLCFSINLKGNSANG